MFDIVKASQNLEDLELHFEYEGMAVFVQWFRAATFKNDHFIEWHNHSFFELHIIKEGMTGVRLDDGGFKACAGDFYINAPGVYHEQFTDEGSPALEYCLSFNIVPNRISNTEAAVLFHILKETPCKPFKDNHGMTALFDIALVKGRLQIRL